MDDFKRINDLYGHRYGDLLLRHFAQRLEKQFDRQHCYRLGGDEFAILLPATGKSSLRDVAEQAAQLLLQMHKEPYQLLNRNLSVSISVGIALPDTGKDHEQQSRQADLALYHAKEQGKNTYAFYEQALSEARAQRDFMEQELSLALERGELFLHYQPKVTLDDGAIIGTEALLRWNHPTLGLIPPAKFIPLAEESLQIVPIGRWILQEACKQGALWHQQGLKLSMAINVSSVQLVHDDLHETVAQALADSQLPANLLELEITETSMIENIHKVLPLLHALRQRGIHLAIDDFGVAYSSLNQLSQLPINVLKIDKSFIDRCVASQQDLMILRSIIQLAANLQLRVVAEGVETDEQRRILQAEGCHYAQGYLFYKPQDASTLQKTLSECANAA